MARLKGCRSRRDCFGGFSVHTTVLRRSQVQPELTMWNENNFL